MSRERDLATKVTPVDWPWHQIEKQALLHLETTEFIRRPDVNSFWAGVIRTSGFGPRKGEHAPLAELDIQRKDNVLIRVLIRVFEPAGAKWPPRTAARLRPAHRALDDGLRTAAAASGERQARLLVEAFRRASSQVPEPVRRAQAPTRPRARITIVSGGLPSLGRRR